MGQAHLDALTVSHVTGGTLCNEGSIWWFADAAGVKEHDVATVRYQIEIDDEQMADLEALRTLGGLRTKKDLVNTALTLLKWAAKRKAQGWSIVCVSETGAEMELDMPFLDAVATNSPEPKPATPVHAATRLKRPSSMRIAERVG
jgi:hypothetical protein